MSSGLKYAFAWTLNSRHSIGTTNVLSNACIPVNETFLPVNYGRQRRLVVQPATATRSRNTRINRIFSGFIPGRRCRD